jgi:assimilatory nitrate reductase catalytic subunit
VLVGSNLAWCHPVLYQRALRRRKDARPDMRIVNIDHAARRRAIWRTYICKLPLMATALFNGLLAYAGMLELSIWLICRSTYAGVLTR